MRLLAALLALHLASDHVVWCARKIRHHKAFSGGRARLAESEIYSFLSAIREQELPASVQYEVVTPQPTTPSTTTTTTSARTTTASLADFCLGKRGQFAYEADCHKFVQCWEGKT
jgi:hypothetical protein